jgi:hypothetical protein
MKKIQKLQVTLNEVARMQQLAGIIPLNENGISEIAVSRKGVKLFHKDFESALEAVIDYAKKRGYDVDETEAKIKGETIDYPNRLGKYYETYINLKKNGKIQPKYLVFGVMYTKPSNLNPISQVKLNFDIKTVKDLGYDHFRKDDLTPEELAIEKQKNKELDDYYYAPMTTKKKPSFLSRVFGKK